MIYLSTKYCTTGPGNDTCTWFGEVCPCCCLSLLPQLGCNILATTYKCYIWGPVHILQWQHFQLSVCSWDPMHVRLNWMNAEWMNGHWNVIPLFLPFQRCCVAYAMEWRTTHTGSELCASRRSKIQQENAMRQAPHCALYHILVGKRPALGGGCKPKSDFDICSDNQDHASFKIR